MESHNAGHTVSSSEPWEVSLISSLAPNMHSTVHVHRWFPTGTQQWDQAAGVWYIYARCECGLKIKWKRRQYLSSWNTEEEDNGQRSVSDAHRQN